MSKAGGIAYLLKHGRAPVPTVTRTQMPRGKGYADGGVPDTTPINNSLGYGPEYDYQFIPGGMELDASGKPVYRSGRFVRKTQPAAAGVAAAAQDPYARTGSSGGSRDGSELPDSGWSGMSMAEKAAYYADRPIEASLASAARGLWDSSLLGRGIGWLADKVNPEGAQERRQSGMVMDAYRNTPGSDRYGLSEDRFGWGANSGGGGYAVPVGGDAIDAVGSGEQAAQDYFRSNPEQFQSQEPSITPAMQAAAAAEGASSENARGGVIRMAAGGIGSLQDHGGFVGSYAQGGRMLRGPGDGLSDHIPAVIGKGKPARLADGEFVVSADVVSTLGGGSTEAGAKKLYAMMDRIRKAGHGSSKQVKPVKEHKVLPA